MSAGWWWLDWWNSCCDFPTAQAAVRYLTDIFERNPYYKRIPYYARHKGDYAIRLFRYREEGDDLAEEEVYKGAKLKRLVTTLTTERTIV